MPLTSLTRSTVVAVLLPLCAFAQEAPTSDGEILLTLSGAISASGAGNPALLDLSALEALEAETFSTTTIWTDGIQTFTGVPLHRLMTHVGAEDGTLRATAINDYAVEIPYEDWSQPGALVAYRKNGELMSVRDKGPLWIVYPYDADPAFQSEVIYSRSIWQLDRIEILE
nr:oxidoreductase [uncultured Celeribacter sp.]